MKKEFPRQMEKSQQSMQKCKFREEMIDNRYTVLNKIWFKDKIKRVKKGIFLHFLDNQATY